jgi:hypothetical protein
MTQKHGRCDRASLDSTTCCIEADGGAARALGLVFAASVSALIWIVYLAADSWTQALGMVVAGVCAALVIAELATDASRAQGRPSSRSTR